jgi:16S rRNA (uracil1498-N3)-methyltransferase
MRRFYAPKENFGNQKIVLSLEETRHLRDVLRLREGDAVRIFDGEGREFSCRIEKIEKKETALDIIEEVAAPAPASNLDLTLAAALLKGEKFDLVVQKACELGVAGLVPVIAGRTDVKLRDAEKKVERWRKIALEAAKQSGRADLMRIEMPAQFADFLKNSAARQLDDEKLLLFSERDGESLEAIEAAKKITAIIGSEGGWEDSEIEAAKNSGFQIVTLKGRILRAETASIAVAAVLQHRFGDFN